MKNNNYYLFTIDYMDNTNSYTEETLKRVGYNLYKKTRIKPKARMLQLDKGNGKKNKRVRFSMDESLPNITSHPCTKMRYVDPISKRLGDIPEGYKRDVTGYRNTNYKKREYRSEEGILSDNVKWIREATTVTMSSYESCNTKGVTITKHSRMMYILITFVSKLLHRPMYKEPKYIPSPDSIPSVRNDLGRYCADNHGKTQVYSSRYNPGLFLGNRLHGNERVIPHPDFKYPTFDMIHGDKTYIKSMLDARRDSRSTPWLSDGMCWINILDLTPSAKADFISQGRIYMPYEELRDLTMRYSFSPERLIGVFSQNNSDDNLYLHVEPNINGNYKNGFEVWKAARNMRKTCTYLYIGGFNDDNDDTDIDYDVISVKDSDDAINTIVPVNRETTSIVPYNNNDDNNDDNNTEESICGEISTFDNIINNTYDNNDNTSTYNNINLLPTSDVEVCFNQKRFSGSSGVDTYKSCMYPRGCNEMRYGSVVTYTTTDDNTPPNVYSTCVYHLHVPRCSHGSLSYDTSEGCKYRVYIDQSIETMLNALYFKHTDIVDDALINANRTPIVLSSLDWIFPQDLITLKTLSCILYSINMNVSTKYDGNIRDRVLHEIMHIRNLGISDNFIWMVNLADGVGRRLVELDILDHYPSCEVAYDSKIGYNDMLKAMIMETKHDNSCMCTIDELQKGSSTYNIYKDGYGSGIFIASYTFIVVTVKNWIIDTLRTLRFR